MGPVKVAIVYLTETADFSPDVRRRVAMRAVAVAGIVAAFLLNPVGIVALISYSGSPELVDIGIVAVAGLSVLGIDLAVLLGLSRVGRLNEQAISVTEIVLGFLLAALAIQLIVDGAVDMGVLQTVSTTT